MNKKVIIHPQWEGKEIPTFLYLQRAIRIAEKWPKEKVKHNKKIGYRHGIVYSWNDILNPLDLYIYETKTAIIVRPT